MTVSGVGEQPGARPAPFKASFLKASAFTTAEGIERVLKRLREVPARSAGQSISQAWFDNLSSATLLFIPERFRTGAGHGLTVEAALLTREECS